MNLYLCSVASDKYKYPYLQIKSVKSELAEELKNIAKNIGDTKTKFLRDKLRAKVQAYDDALKEPSEKSSTVEIFITNVSPGLKEDMNNIADNIGLSHQAFQKLLLHEITSEYDAQMKLPPREFD